MKFDPFFRKNEVRVIRKRYFSKYRSFEYGLKAGILVNSNFVNIGLLDGNIGFHINDYFGFRAFAVAGLGFYNDNFKELDDVFSIFPEVRQNNLQVGLDLIFTFVYGKAISQVLITYFDTYMLVGGGMGSLKFLAYNSIDDAKEEYEKWFPVVNIGVGQRFYLSSKSSINWELRDSISIYQSYLSDPEFKKNMARYEEDTSQVLYHSMVFLIGMSFF